MWCEHGTKIEALGVMIDSEAMRVTVEERRAQRYLVTMKGLAAAEGGSAVEVARVLGRLVSVELAVPGLLIASRPLFEDLKAALLKANRAALGEPAEATARTGLRTVRLDRPPGDAVRRRLRSPRLGRDRKSVV